MKILITDSDRFTVTDGPAPTVGSYYFLDDANSPTNRQNRAFHALLTEYWVSGASSNRAKTFERFREEVKMKLGAGYEKLVYADIEDGKAVIIQVKHKDEIPTRILQDKDLSRMVLAKPKSWGDYTLKERRDTIDRLIAEMHQVGIKTKKFFEILEGMENG